jgi:hypothetical protein
MSIHFNSDLSSMRRNVMEPLDAHPLQDVVAHIDTTPARMTRSGLRAAVFEHDDNSIVAKHEYWSDGLR